MQIIIKAHMWLTTIAASLLLVVIPIALPAAAFADGADISGNLCAGASLDVDTDGGCGNTFIGADRINNIIHSVINLFSLIVGIVSVIMIIVGGLRYIISGGASDNVSGAKNTIVYAIIGLVVVALAQFIVQFVLSKVTSTVGSGSY